MIVRDARLDECAILAALTVEQPLMQRYGARAEALAERLAQALGRGDGLVVVEEQGEPRGFAWFYDSGTFGRGGYLRLIVLGPGSEGRGLGGALLDEVERRVARTSDHLFLLVSAWNHDARRFYAQRGYLESGALPAFVLADTDEVICWKRLESPAK